MVGAQGVDGEQENVRAAPVAAGGRREQRRHLAAACERRHDEREAESRRDRCEREASHETAIEDAYAPPTGADQATSESVERDAGRDRDVQRLDPAASGIVQTRSSRAATAAESPAPSAPSASTQGPACRRRASGRRRAPSSAAQVGGDARATAVEAGDGRRRRRLRIVAGCRPRRAERADGSGARSPARGAARRRRTPLPTRATAPRLPGSCTAVEVDVDGRPRSAAATSTPARGSRRRRARRAASRRRRAASSMLGVDLERRPRQPRRDAAPVGAGENSSVTSTLSSARPRSSASSTRCGPSSRRWSPCLRRSRRIAFNVSFRRPSIMATTLNDFLGGYQRGIEVASPAPPPTSCSACARRSGAISTTASTGRCRWRSCHTTSSRRTGGLAQSDAEAIEARAPRGAHARRSDSARHLPVLRRRRSRA